MEDDLGVRPDRSHAEEVETLYQKRSAIKKAFRTIREVRARTSTTDPTVWSLFVLVRFLMRWGVLARRGAAAEHCRSGSNSGRSASGLTTHLRNVGSEMGSPDKPDWHPTDVQSAGYGLKPFASSDRPQYER